MGSIPTSRIPRGIPTGRRWQFRGSGRRRGFRRIEPTDTSSVAIASEQAHPPVPDAVALARATPVQGMSEAFCAPASGLDSSVIGPETLMKFVAGTAGYGI